MNFPSIRIEGTILSPDILGHVESLSGQRPTDFELAPGMTVKDEIARSWADAQDYWRIFQRKMESVNKNSNATSETRNLWMIPLMGLLRYDIEFQTRGSELNGRVYTISHRAINRAYTPMHIVGARDPAGLDRKASNTNRRMSAHALVQEYLNLHDQLYGFVSDGLVLRLLRDNSRLVNQSYLEFDLDRIFTDGLFSDFAILYRLLHASRLPHSTDAVTESLIERYHQDSLDQGARIREGLRQAVEKTILEFGNGFLAHSDNEDLRFAIASSRLSPSGYYQQLLRLIYRLLFLMVIEERDLVFPEDAPTTRRQIYRDYYSVTRLRRLSENRYLSDPRRYDLWLALLACFRLFESDGPGGKLGIAPLAGDLFSSEAIGALATCKLGNDVLLDCLRSLDLYQHPDSRHIIRVNYAALNVEEFGSVYEGLLEYEPVFDGEGTSHELRFKFSKGEARAATGSHYTPDDLVQPLIQHSLDHLIAARLKDKDPEVALLDFRIADIACGSGHILLAAARRIATKLAAVRTDEEQPSPSAYRAALRDVVRNCVYGVDVNPLAVELCKVALWLEAHIPGQPLNFLDHHIKCGNAIVGFTHQEDLGQGVPTEAFKTLPGDDKEIANAKRKINRVHQKRQTQTSLVFAPELRTRLNKVRKEWCLLSALSEETPAQIEVKKERFASFNRSEDAILMRSLADIPLAQFYITKVPGNETSLLTDEEYRRYMNGNLAPSKLAVDIASNISKEKRFFHWFLEFPEIIDRGGFDCILGNPPYLGGQALSGSYGYGFCELMKWLYSPTGLNDLVVFFLRRLHVLLRDGGFTAIITTNSIIDGDVRKDGLKQVVERGSQINMAVRGMKWPGTANLFVSLLAIHKGKWCGLKMIDNQPVSKINTFFEEGEEYEEPINLVDNRDRMYQGSIFLGDGFLLSHDEASLLLSSNPSNADVIVPIINGKELNNDPSQSPGRRIINFRNWSIEKARKYPEPFSIVEESVKPYRATQNRKRNREVWWVFAEHRPGLTKAIRNLPHCFVAARTTKHLSFSAMPTNYVFSDALYVFATDRWDLFAVVHSTLHEIWARKYSGSLATILRYSPSDCFETFTFPIGIWQSPNTKLSEAGERYHTQRKMLMQLLGLGLTKIYNLFHNPNLSPQIVSVASKRTVDSNEGFDAMVLLRQLHVEMDIAVRDAYGWHDLDLDHDFHEVENLPENDRVRYTICPVVRREVMRRLLSENHARVDVESMNTSDQTELNSGSGRGVPFNHGLFTRHF